MRFALLDAAGNVVNVIEWDGASRWSPPAAHTVRPADENTEPGGRWDGDRFHRKPPEDLPPQPKTKLEELEARLAALEARTP